MTDTGAGVGSGKPDAVALADKVDFLSATGSYPGERPEVVEARETHMSSATRGLTFAHSMRGAGIASQRSA